MRSAAVRQILAKVGLLPRKDLPRPEERRVVRGRILRQLLALVVLIVMASLAGQSLAPAPAHASGPAGNELIQVPLRWCALSGTKAVTNPGSFGEPNTTSVLLRRQERASSQIWIPGANITFRSPFPASVPASSAKFPVIGDPGPPPVLGSADGLNGPGQNGDILFPQTVATAAEWNQARSECEEEWDHLAEPPPAGIGISMKGPIALNIRQFVDANGNPVSLLGQGEPPTNYSVTGISGAIPPWCETPPVKVTAA